MDCCERVDFDAQMSFDNLHKSAVSEIREIKLHVDESARRNILCRNVLENFVWTLVVNGKDAAMWVC